MKAVMHIYGKNLKNLLLLNQWTDFTETWYEAWGFCPIIVCINHDFKLTVTCLMAKPFLSINMIFSERFVPCDLKVGRYRQLIELVKLCEYSRSQSRLFWPNAIW